MRSNRRDKAYNSFRRPLEGSKNIPGTGRPGGVRYHPTPPWTPHVASYEDTSASIIYLVCLMIVFIGHHSHHQSQARQVNKEYLVGGKGGGQI